MKAIYKLSIEKPNYNESLQFEFSSDEWEDSDDLEQKLKKAREEGNQLLAGGLHQEERKLQEIKRERYDLKNEVKDLTKKLDRAKERWDNVRSFLEKLGFDPEEFAKDNEIPF